MSKRIMVMLLIVCMLLIAVAGCTQGTTTTATTKGTTTKATTTKATTSEESNITAPGELPIVKDKVTINIMATLYPNIIDMPTNYVTTWLEEQTNIHIEWEILAGSEAKQQVNLLLSSGGDLPDAFQYIGFSNAELLIYGSQGLFVPWNDMIDEYGFHLQQWHDYNAEIKKDQTAPDGNIYGLGSYNECFHCWHSQKMWINQKWLDNLDLETPTTTEEFYDILKAFKEFDANGNGDPNDEIPLTGSYGAWRGNIDGFLMCPFVYNDGGNRLFIDNGQVKAAYMEPGWREGLRYLNRLYNENLLDKECFIVDYLELMQYVNDGVFLIGAAPGGQPGCFANLDEEYHKEFVALAPLKGPTGLQYTGFYPTQTSGASFVITKDNEHPVETFRWADFCTSLEAHKRIFFGEEGVDWRLAEPGEVGLDGLESSALFKEINYISSTSTPQNKCWSHTFPVWTTHETFNGRVSDPEDVWYLEARLYKATKEQYLGYEPTEVVRNYYMNADDAVIFTDLQAPINTYVMESIAKFVVGEMSIENDWDSYLNEFTTLKIDDYLALIQKYYDARK